jgi:hypothetical protein
MQITVFVERLAGNGYRVSGGSPFPFSVEGATREEALSKLQEKITASLATGAEVVALDVATQPNPWLGMAGMFDRDDPLVKEWIEIMAENRRKAEEEPDLQ